MRLTLVASFLKRSRQSVGFQFGRIKAAGNVANLNNGFVDETGQFVQLTGVTGSFAIQVTCEGLYGEGRPEKVLAQVVMHLPSNPLLFAFLRTQKRVFQELEFGDVADQERTPAGFGPGRTRADPHHDCFACLRLAHALKVCELRRCQKAFQPSLGAEKRDLATNDFRRFPTENKLRSVAPGGNFKHFTDADQCGSARFKETHDIRQSFKPYPLSGFKAIFRTHE